MSDPSGQELLAKNFSRLHDDDLIAVRAIGQPQQKFPRQNCKRWARGSISCAPF
jgi:hypothetical protein